MRENSGVAQGNRTGWLTAVSAVCVLYVVSAGIVSAQEISGLDDFDGSDGAVPLGGLVQATDGNLYGTTFEGGANNGCSPEYIGCGTAFRITPSGTLTTIYNFCSLADCADGYSPAAGLVQAGDGNLYGTTYGGGRSGVDGGTIFRLTLGGTLTTLYSFCSQPSCTDGSNPAGALIQGTDGDLYGTAFGGGNTTSPCDIFYFGCGTIFKTTLTGTFATVYTFCSQADCIDGENPAAGLIQGTDGNLHGTTAGGGANFDECYYYGCGTVFTITPAGAPTTLYSFCSQTNCTDGATPLGGLVQASNGQFYGTTDAGGDSNCSEIGCGTVFRIARSGAFARLYAFKDEYDGFAPEASLVQGTDGNLYGTTTGNTLFKITPKGAFTAYSLPGGDGTFPAAPLAQDTSGSFYGTASEGGTNEDGTIFTLSVGLGPFVQAYPTSAKVGKPINILGTNLTGATSVTFNGVGATFTVVSSSLITTTVPQGATTGYVKVTTPQRTLKSNVPFRVVQ